MEESATELEKEVSFGNFGKWEKEPTPPILVNSGNQSLISSCRICLSSLLDPARLDCGHRFCESCLNKYWKANEEPSFVVCPLCRDYAFKIGFEQKNYEHSTRDFRKKFDPDHIDIPPIVSKTVEIGPNYNIVMKLWPLMMPLLYFVVIFVKPYVLDLFVALN